MSEDTRKYWRLVETSDRQIVAMIQGFYVGRWFTERGVYGNKATHITTLLNSLLANKERSADGELDWSALSKETCEALRKLGVAIPEKPPREVVAQWRLVGSSKLGNREGGHYWLDLYDKRDGIKIGIPMGPDEPGWYAYCQLLNGLLAKGWLRGLEALSKETCEALRGLGVNIPEEVKL